MISVALERSDTILTRSPWNGWFPQSEHHGASGATFARSPAAVEGIFCTLALPQVLPSDHFVRRPRAGSPARGSRRRPRR